MEISRRMCNGLIVFNPKRDGSVAGLTGKVCRTAIEGQLTLKLPEGGALVSHKKRKCVIEYACK